MQKKEKHMGPILGILDFLGTFWGQKYFSTEKAHSCFITNDSLTSCQKKEKLDQPVSLESSSKVELGQFPSIFIS